MQNYEYLSPKGITEKYPIALGGIRDLLLHRKTNGLESCVRYIGKKILIRRDLFDAWIESKSGENNNG